MPERTAARPVRMIRGSRSACVAWRAAAHVVRALSAAVADAARHGLARIAGVDGAHGWACAAVTGAHPAGLERSITHRIAAARSRHWAPCAERTL